jgi:hypothetical protein
VNSRVTTLVAVAVAGAFGCSGEEDFLSVREAPIEVHAPFGPGYSSKVLLVGTSLNDLWASTHEWKPNYSHSVDGVTWNHVPIPPLDQALAKGAHPAHTRFAAAGPGAIWVSVALAPTPGDEPDTSFLGKVMADGTIEDHSADVPAGWVVEWVFAGAGGAFCTMRTENGKGDYRYGLLRLAGGRYTEIPNMPENIRILALAAAGPDEAYFELFSDYNRPSVIHYKAGALASVPYLDDQTWMQVAVGATGEAWLMDAACNSWPGGLHVDGERSEQVKLSGPGGGEGCSVLVTAAAPGKVGVVRGELVSDDQSLRFDISYHAFDGKGAHRSAVRLMRRPGVGSHSLYPTLLDDGNLILVHTGGPTVQWYVGNIGQLQ